MRINDLLKYVAFIMIAALPAACSDDDDFSPYRQQATIVSEIIGYNQTENQINTAGDPSYTWKASLDAEWCSFSQSAAQSQISGKPGQTITIFCSVNNTDRERTATIQVVFSDGTQKTCSFRQLGNTYDSTYEHTWGEQPSQAWVESPNYIYKTYYTILANSTRYVRNYSVCFDTETKVSRWVAYPVHDIYTSGRSYTTYPSTTNGRTNAWAFDDAVTEYYGNTDNYNTAYTFISTYDRNIDSYNTYTQPIIPQAKQQNIASIKADGSPYSTGGAYGDQQVVRSLNRGHMLPSASRYSTWNTNAQTFYATNMMPQNGTFNSGSWGDVETATRNSRCDDTLFVVVGTLYEPGTRITSRGREITVPSHCYKLLLRTKNGRTGKYIGDITDASQLQAIGFLFQNAAAASNVSAASAAVSVKDIEERAGFTFFHNLNPAVAEKVKSQCNINDWPAFR